MSQNMSRRRTGCAVTARFERSTSPLEPRLFPAICPVPALTARDAIVWASASVCDRLARCLCPQAPVASGYTTPQHQPVFWTHGSGLQRRRFWRSCSLITWPWTLCVSRERLCFFATGKRPQSWAASDTTYAAAASRYNVERAYCQFGGSPS